MKNKLKIRGARQHNLKEVAVDIEKNKELSLELNDQLGVSKMRSFIGQSLHKLKKLKLFF